MSLSPMLHVTCSAPGKIILSGEHSVVYPGRPAIAASISKRCSCSLNITREETVTIRLNSLNFTRTLSLNEMVKAIKSRKESAVNAGGKCDLKEIAGECTAGFLQMYSSDADSFAMKNALHVILFLLTSMFCQIDKDHLSKCPGLVLTVNSDLVLGAGSGSSAAFAVSVAGSVYTYLRWLACSMQDGATVALEKHVHMNANSWDTITSEDLDLINSLAFGAEKITHGTPSGLDNTICTYGGVVKLKRYEAGNEIEKTRATLPLEVLLIDTGVSRSTSNLVAKVAALKVRHEVIFEQLLTALGSVTESFLDVLKSLSEIDPSDGVKMRTEFQKLEDLIDMNQGLLTSLGVSHPSLNQIIDICKINGLHAKLTGAGGGGYAFAVIPPAFEKQSVDKCVEELERAKYKVYRDLKLGGPGFELKVENETVVEAV
uniref:Mevalonate kinase n=1 Tax=Cacopsylla melanoneura TaxID=428564 RepID=A0A8D8YGY8_9HEMI